MTNISEERVINGKDKDICLEERGEQGCDVIGEGVVGVEEKDPGAAHSVVCQPLC